MIDKKKSSKIHILFFLSTYFLMFITGLGVLSTGAILPEIVKEFDISYDIAGVLLSLLAIGNMSALVVSGYLSDFIGRKVILLIGSLLITAGFGSMTFASSAPVLSVLIFIAGCGWGVNNIVSGIMNDITGGSAKQLNRLHIFFAAGAFTAPFFVIFADMIGMGWRTVCGTIGILAACSTILLTVIKLPAAQKSRQKQKGNHKDKDKKNRVSGYVLFEPFTHMRYYVFLAISFTYTAVETVMNGWITTYFQDTGILTPVEAKTVLSLVWASIMTGRIAFSFIGDKIKKEYIITACSFVILIFTVVLIQLDSFISVAICVFMLGLGLSAVIPTNLANADVTVKGSGIAMGILLSSGGLGAAAGPVITGMTAEHINISASMWVAAAFAFILMLSAFVNYILGRSTQTKK